MVTPVAHWEAVAHLCTAYEMSERRACCIIGCDRASVRYQPRAGTMLSCANGSGPWRMSDGGSVTGTGVCSCAGRAIW
jgi:hypothetical protein